MALLYYPYMLINLLTDSKKTETYNRLHLLLLVILLPHSIKLSGIVVPFLLIVITLITGLILEKLPFLKIGSGDTKMVVVSTLFILTTIEYTHYFELFLIPFFIYLFMVFINQLISVSLLICFLLYSKTSRKDYGNNTDFGFLKYRIKINKTTTKTTVTTVIPATFGIIISVSVLQLLF